MEAEYLREQESESAGVSGFSQLEDKVMKTAAQFFWEGFASLCGYQGPDCLRGTYRACPSGDAQAGRRL